MKKSRTLHAKCVHWGVQMKHLNVVGNPPAFVLDPSLTLTNVTFDPDVLDFVLDISDAKSHGYKDLNFYLVNYFLVTDRQRDRQKAMVIKELTMREHRWAQKWIHFRWER